MRAWDGDFSLDDLNEGGRGAVQNSTPSSSDSSLYDTRAYNADMLKFKQMVMSNQDSSEYGANTSEFGLERPSTSTTSLDDSGEHFGPQRRQQQHKYYM